MFLWLHRGCGGEYAYIDVVDYVQRVTRVVIWWEGGDDTISLVKVHFVLLEDWWGGL